MSDLSKKRVLLSGAARGLGFELAREMVSRGADVALLSRDPVALERVGEQLQAQRLHSSQTVRWYAVDLADVDQIDQVMHACLDNFGSIDILVNNAAVQGPIGRFDQTDWQAWRRVFDVNFFGAARLCWHVIPSMKLQRYGKIINLSGGGATAPRPDLSAYAASKCALVRLSETLAEELREYSIDVNCVAPGAMNTRMLDELLAAGPDGARREYARALEQARTGGVPPSRAVELIVFLASPASDGITGRLISAVWDKWTELPNHRKELATSDIFTLRRIIPEDRGMKW